MAQGNLSAASLRLMNDLMLIRKDPPAGCSASPVNDDNLFVWRATISGPPETPWEGGVYSLCLNFNDNYPEEPPTVRFTTEMFHPNVCPHGVVFLDILEDKWSPANTISTILTSIRSFLNDPNPMSPANSVAVYLYINDRNAYKKKVRLCAEKSVDC